MNSKNKGINYKKAYAIYKKLPIINFIATMVLSLAWGITDAFAWLTPIGEDMEIGAILIWILIGGVLAALTYFFTMVGISATVVRTDAALNITEKKD